MCIIMRANCAKIALNAAWMLYPLIMQCCNSANSIVLPLLPLVDVGMAASLSGAFKFIMRRIIMVAVQTERSQIEPQRQSFVDTCYCTFGQLRRLQLLSKAAQRSQ